MPSRLTTLTFDARDPARLAGFWAGVLGRAAMDRGAGHSDVGERPAEGHVVLADPEGNEFCLLDG